MSYSQNMIDGLNLLKKLEIIIDESIADTYTKAQQKSNDPELLDVETDEPLTDAQVAKIWQKAIDLNNDFLSTKMHIDYIRGVLIRMRPSEEMNNEIPN